MKKVILNISLAFLATGVFAQKAEIQAANNAFQNKNYSKVLESAEMAEPQLGTDYTISPKQLADFYKNVAQSAKQVGDSQTAAKYYARLSKLESKKYYEAKNKDTKKTEYFLDKKTAEEVTSKGNYRRLKERNAETSYMRDLYAGISDDANKSLNEGNEAFSAKNYNVAGDKFLESYYLSSALGAPNNLIKYYSAIAYLQTDDKKQKAADLLSELIDDKYTGVETKYYAKLKDSDDEVSFASKEDMDSQVKLGLYTDPRVEKTESIEEDLYSNAVYAFYHTEDYDKGIIIAKKGLEKYPDNENMNQLISGMYYKSGKSDEFVKDLRNKVENGNASAIDYFNLAKQLEDNADGTSTETIRNYYKKSIEKDPEFSSAYLNLAFSIISDEQPYVDLMNSNLGTTAKEKKIYKENAAKRKALYVEALPYLEKAYELDSDNATIVRILRNAYDVTGNDDKFIKMKKLLEDMQE